MMRSALLAAWALVAVSCNHHRNDPGWAYMADFDMYYSKPYDAYTANPVFADSLTMQSTPEGSIPRGHMPYPYLPKSMDEQVRAGKELLNPLEPTRADLLEGREQYLIYCSSCHGERGDGKGHLYASKRFPAAPTSLIEAYVQNKPDGEIYHVITRGSVSGLMGPLASQVRSDNRWKIISYVRELGKK
jgi:mono/diheme cytochrome c family protein